MKFQIVHQALFYRVRLGTIALLLCMIATSALAEDDQVYLKRGGAVSGTVAGSTPIAVTVDVRGKTQTVPVNEIRLITFADEPQTLRQGRARAAGGNYESGLNDLKKVDPATIEREIVKRDLQFYVALCEGRLALSAGGDKASATDTTLAFVRAAQSSFHFFEAARLLGDLAVGQEDFASAVKYYGAIASKAPWPEYQMGALLAEARALVAQGDFAAAAEKFDGVMSQQSDTPEVKRQKLFAQIGKGRCLCETQSPEEGISVIEQVIAENDATDMELFGRAYNAHGDCLQKAGKPKEALMAYLHVDVLFYSEPEIHAEALYHLGKLWSAAKKPDRAASARNLLQQRYSGSTWASRP